MSPRWLAHIALLLSLLPAAHAKDLGVQGTVFPIIEVDMRRLVRESLETVDVPALQSQVKDSAKRYVRNLPKRSLPSVETTKTQWLDLSFTLTSAIQAPVRQADGSWKWQVLHPAGTKVNPLDSRRPTKAMLFIDGSVAEQVHFAKELSAVAKARLMVVEAGQGDILEVNRQLGQALYYGDDRLMSRFQVTALPALLFAGDGQAKRFMGVTFFASPYQLKDAATWELVRGRLDEKAKAK